MRDLSLIGGKRMNEAEIEIKMDKFVKQRPKTNFYTGAIYTPRETKEREKMIADAFRIKNKEWVCDEGPIGMETLIQLKVPSKESNRKKAKMLIGEIWPTVKPDVDNVLKLVMDALQGVAYVNDKQVVDEHTIKIYGEENKIKIILRKVL